MARGSIAKENVIAKIQEAFGADWIGEENKKYYVWAKDGSEKVQICISLTCPKNPVGTVDMSSAFGDGIDFEAEPVLAPTKFEPAEITEQEKDNLKALMDRLGL